MAKANNNNLTNRVELSIQISLNGLSFCTLNKDENKIEFLKHNPLEKKLTPFQLLDELKDAFNAIEELQQDFKSIQLIYTNELATIVPKPLFNEDNLADYLKFNSKILKSDFVTFDDMPLNDSVNVYVPYVNINNFIYDKFGEFTYKHFSTILIEELLKLEKKSESPVMYVHVRQGFFEIVVITSSKLQLYNSFEFISKEDFIYYILFTAEQLQLNPETVRVVLLGAIKKGDDLYKMIYKYVRHVSFGNRFDNYNYLTNPSSNYSDFTLIKSF